MPMSTDNTPEQPVTRHNIRAQSSTVDLITLPLEIDVNCD
jgi:hypothetical protein